MNFDNKTITYAGASLMAHSDTIKKATVVDSVIISSNTPSSNADFAKLSFDDFGSYQEYPVVNIRQNDNVFQPEAVISNEGFSRDFPLLMVGLKGHTDGEENSSIIAVAVDKSNSPFTIPKQTSVPYKLYLDLPIGYSNSNNVIMNVNNAGLVTMDDVNHAISIAFEDFKSYAQYNIVSELNDNDDILKLPKNGHFIINGTNPRNNPWDKNIWADVYKTDYNIVVHDNVGGEFIRSYFDKSWHFTLNNNDLDKINNSISSMANSNSAATRSVADSLGDWNRNGFDSVGGSVAWLYGQNEQRASDNHSNSVATRSVADSLGRWIGSGFDSLGTIQTSMFYQASNQQTTINNMSSKEQSDVNSLSNATRSVADSLGDWNRNGFDSVGGSVAWLYGQNEQRANDIANNANKITSVADSLGNWNRSGFDSLGGSVAYLNDQNNDRIKDVNSLASDAIYNVVKYLNDSDDILSLNKNGHYVINGANPKNNPWGKNIWADVYKTDYQTILRDNVGGEFIRSNFDSTWKMTLNNNDFNKLQTELNTIDNTVITGVTLDGSSDLNNVTFGGTFWCNFSVPKNSPSDFAGTYPRFKLVVTCPIFGICNQVIYMLDGANTQGLHSMYVRRTSSQNSWTNWEASL